MEFRRKLYTRGSSYETTIPMPLLFPIDKKKKYDVVFSFDSTSNKWFVQIEQKESNGLEEKNTLPEQGNKLEQKSQKSQKTGAPK